MNKTGYGRNSSMELLKTTEGSNLHNGGHSHIPNAGLVFNGSAKNQNDMLEDDLFIPRCPSSPSIMNRADTHVAKNGNKKHVVNSNNTSESQSIARKRLSLGTNESHTNGANNGYGRNDKLKTTYSSVYGIEGDNPYRFIDMNGSWKDWYPGKSK